MPHHPTWIEINLDQLRKNIHLIQNYIAPAKYCLPIKSNAYGHGILEIAAVAETEKVDYLAVASLSEGVMLRNHGIKLPILVLGGFLEEQIEDFIRYSLDFSISSEFKTNLVEEKLAALNQQAFVHLKIETGMQRVGARPETALKIYQRLLKSKHIVLKGVYSHLACADHEDQSVSLEQMRVFKSFLDKIHVDDLLIHLSNSSGILQTPNQFENMVRPGLLTFGLSTQPLPECLAGVESFFSLKSRVSYFKVVDKDKGVSYGHTYKTKAQTRIATIPIGYGDGYRRALSNKGSVLIRGKKYPICGTICMDQLMVDIGEGEAYVGDEVVLIGKQHEQSISINEIADHCATIPYEILCGFNERVPRFYSSESKLVAG